MNTCTECGARWDPGGEGNSESCPNCIATGRGQKDGARELTDQDFAEDVKEGLE